MATQVITIGQTGSLLGLRSKKGEGVDLRKLGPAKIRRITNIVWADDCQKWFIVWASGMRSGDRVQVPTCLWAVSMESLASYETVFFRDYEDAVSAEVEVIQTLQLAGNYRELISG